MNIHYSIFLVVASVICRVFTVRSRGQLEAQRLKIGRVAASLSPANMPSIWGVNGEALIQKTPPYFYLNGGVEKELK